MYKRILVAVDGSSTGNLALQEAIKLAREGQSRLKLVHVVDETLINWDEGGWLGGSTVFEALAAAGRKVLDAAVETVRREGLDVESQLVESVARRIGSVISEEAESWQADLIVVGTHGRRGVDRLLLGSVAEGVVRTAAVPVLLVRGKLPG